MFLQKTPYKMEFFFAKHFYLSHKMFNFILLNSVRTVTN